MAKVRLEDVYDEDDNQFEETFVPMRKRKQRKDIDDIYEKNKRKNKTCRIKANRKVKTDFETSEED